MSKQIEDKFDIKEFKKRTGMTGGTLWYHKSKGHFPNKTVLTQADVDEFTSKYKNENLMKKGTKKSAAKKKQHAVPTLEKPSMDTLTRDQFIEKIGMSRQAFYQRTSKGHIKLKKTYTLQDVEAFNKKYTVRKQNNNEFLEKVAKGVYSPKEKSPSIVAEEDVDPFEIRSGVVITGATNIYFEKLLAKIVELKVYSKDNYNDYIYFPASVYKTLAKASSAFKGIKTHIRKNRKDLEKCDWKIINKKNADNVYTHSQIIRIA